MVGIIESTGDLLFFPNIYTSSWLLILKILTGTGLIIWFWSVRGTLAADRAWVCFSSLLLSCVAQARSPCRPGHLTGQVTVHPLPSRQGSSSLLRALVRIQGVEWTQRVLGVPIKGRVLLT